MSDVIRLGSFWRWLGCRLWFGHDLYTIARVSSSSFHVGCRHCERQWGINYDVRAALRWHHVQSLYFERGYLGGGKWKEGCGP